MARPEKPNEQRRNRSLQRREWTILPAEGRKGPAPKLPGFRSWQDATLDWWSDLWASPQATMWDQSGRTLHELALLYDDLVCAGSKEGASSSTTLTALVAQMRQIQARHGLDPRSMADMKWKVAEADTPSTTSGTTATGTVLSIVPDPPDPSEMPAKRARKADWVDWAVRCGMERSAAERVAKSKLIAEFSSIAPAERPLADRPVSRAAERVKSAQAAKQPARKTPRKGGRKGRS